LGSWSDILKKTEPNVMTLKIQKDVDVYKVVTENHTQEGDPIEIPIISFVSILILK